MSNVGGNAEISPEEVFDYDDLYDSERLAISRVMAALSQHVGTTSEKSAIQREVRDRFSDIGFVARCDFYKDDDDPRPWNERPDMPQITIVGRTEKQGEFDHDRMGHEVRSNILGKNAQGDVQSKTVGQTGYESRKSGIVVPKGT